MEGDIVPILWGFFFRNVKILVFLYIKNNHVMHAIIHKYAAYFQNSKFHGG